MRLGYYNQKVEKIFLDFGKMGKKIPAEWVRKIKQHLDRLAAAETFADFLTLGLGKPERLEGHHGQVQFSIHVSPNVRLIIIPEIEDENYSECRDVQIRGVCDYHGDKTNWYIP